MIISLSILLLLLFTLGFWIVKGTNVPMLLKIISITLFFLFCVIMGISLDSSMGWATTNLKNLPKVVTIRHVIIKEPNLQVGFSGSIYFLLDIPLADRNDVLLVRLLGDKPEKIEPRLFRLPYSRKLHEQLQKEILPRLAKGQTIRGRLTKGNPNGKNKGGLGKKGEVKGKEKGGGSESLNTDYQFYELPPSYFSPKLP